MTDIDHRIIMGPAGAPESIRRNERTAADADKFKQEMERKLSQVNESDPEQLKKRKRQSGEEEEEPTPETQATPSSHVSPFDLEKQTKPIDLGEGGKISPLASAQPTESMYALQGENYTIVPFEESTNVDDEMSTLITAPSSAESSSQAGIGQEAPSPQFVPEVSMEKQGPVQPQEQQPVQPATQQGTPEKSSGGVGKPASSEQAPSSMKGKEPSSVPVPSKEETAALFAQMGQKDQPSIVEKKKVAAEEAAGMGVAAPSPTMSPQKIEQEEKKDHRKKEKEIAPLKTELGTPTSQLPMQGETPEGIQPPLAPYTTMNAQVLDLFERMVGVMTIMTDSKMTETVITLNTPHFASSVFYGSQIIIREYASAPKVFNIQLNGYPEAVALFQENEDDLMAAFQYGNYNFRVNRLETGHLTERPMFHRKEKPSGDKQDQEHP
jgi:hypothetical protein